MKLNKKGAGGSNAFWGFFGVLAVIGIIIVFFFTTKVMLAQWGSLGGQLTFTQTPFNIPSWNGLGDVLENTLNFIFGVDSISDWQFFAVMVLVFVILGVAFTDIFSSFTTFSTVRATIIAWALATLASILGVVKGIAIWFGLTAGLGAVGIGIVLVNSVVVFVAINLFMGRSALIAMKEKKEMGDIAGEASKTKLAYAKARKTVDAINAGNEPNRNP